MFRGFLPFFATGFAGLSSPVVVCAAVATIGSIVLPNRPKLDTDG